MKKKKIKRPIEEIMEDILEQLKIKNSQPVWPTLLQPTIQPTVQCSFCRVPLYPYQIHTCNWSIGGGPSSTGNDNPMTGGAIKTTR